MAVIATMIDRHRSAFAAWIRRLVAAGSVVIVLALAVLAASPGLHSKLHNGDAGHDEGCPVAAFSSGVTVPVAGLAPVPPAEQLSASRAIVAEQVFFASPRYLRQPERGPPALG